ncbi:MAG: hypothetical protein ACR2JX_08430, partial [Mycobacteriales bacterium]
FSTTGNVSTQASATKHPNTPKTNTGNKENKLHPVRKTKYPSDRHYYITDDGVRHDVADPARFLIKRV